MEFRQIHESILLPIMTNHGTTHCAHVAILLGVVASIINNLDPRAEMLYIVGSVFGIWMEHYLVVGIRIYTWGAVRCEGYENFDL